VLASDLQQQLSSLPTVGKVAVERNQNNRNGFDWHVTFLSNSGDVDNMQISYNPDELRGNNVTLLIYEQVKGVAPKTSVVANGLHPGKIHIARIVAMNDVGRGNYTTSIQNKGKGVMPLGLSTKAPPAEPIVDVNALSSSELEIKYSVSNQRGDSIKSYKVEWTTDTAFGTPEVVEIKIQCGQTCDLKGTFRITLEDNLSHILTGATIPLAFNASASEMRDVLKLLLPDAGDMSIDKREDDLREVRWLVTFNQWVGDVRDLSVAGTLLSSHSSR
jgi:hypothetical protein